VSRQFTVTKAAQTITFLAIDPHTLTDPDFDPAAYTSAGLTVSYTASGAACAMTGDGLVHLLISGTCKIKATQAGTATYGAAIAVSRQFTVTKAAQTITFPAIDPHTLVDADFTPGATASSGLAVSYKVSGAACTLAAGGLVHLVSTGNCKVTAAQAGSTVYQPATSVSSSFSVTRATQTIDFPAMDAHALGDPDFDSGASASSGLPISYTASGSACSVRSDGLVHLVAVGTCKIVAAQAGSTSYAPATAVSRTFQVTNPASHPVILSVSHKWLIPIEGAVGATSLQPRTAILRLSW
jgi:hypothetical protein